MTNHPHRKRDEITPSTGDAAAVEPLAPQPAHTPNGKMPDPVPTAAAAIGEAVAGAIGAVLPQAIFGALVQALTQVPVQTRQHMCVTCIAQRIAWEQAHRPEIEAAMAAAAEAPPGQADFGPFLPPDLRPGARSGLPGVNEAITTAGGNEVCPMHIPGVQAGRSPLLVATATMNPAMLGQFAGTG